MDIAALVIAVGANPQAFDEAVAEAVSFLHERIAVRRREEEDGGEKPTLQ
jgi:hypothetical protein